MNPGRLCQIILKSYKEINGYGQLAQNAIFAYDMIRQTPLIALPLLRFPGFHKFQLSWRFSSGFPTEWLWNSSGFPQIKLDLNPGRFPLEFQQKPHRNAIKILVENTGIAVEFPLGFHHYVRFGTYLGVSHDDSLFSFWQPQQFRRLLFDTTWFRRKSESLFICKNVMQS